MAQISNLEVFSLSVETPVQQLQARVSQERLIRAVASSTAIETGRSVAELEALLKAKSGKFTNLTLAN